MGPLTVTKDKYHETISIESTDDVVCVFWHLDEETHNRFEYENAEANAEFMVTACNAYEQLQAELSAVKTELEQMREDRAKAVTDSTLWKCHAEGAETETWRMRQRNAELRKALSIAVEQLESFAKHMHAADVEVIKGACRLTLDRISEALKGDESADDTACGTCDHYDGACNCKQATDMYYKNLPADFPSCEKWSGK